VRIRGPGKPHIEELQSLKVDPDIGGSLDIPTWGKSGSGYIQGTLWFRDSRDRSEMGSVEKSAACRSWWGRWGS
jgi:hypothetical protein